MDQAPGCGSGGERRLVPRIAARYLVILNSLLYVMPRIHIRTCRVFFRRPARLALTSCQLLTRRQEVIKTLNQQRRLIFSTPHSFDSISCTPSRSNHLQAKLIRFFSVLSFVSLVLPVCSLLFEKGIFAENLRMI